MARTRNRGRVIYDNDATVVTEGTAVADDVSIVKRSEVRGAERVISARDALDTLAGYIAQNFPMDRPMNERGMCVLCGKETAYPMRKLCVECMSRNSKNIYASLRRIVADSDDMITIE